MNSTHVYIVIAGRMTCIASLSIFWVFAFYNTVRKQLNLDIRVRVEEFIKHYVVETRNLLPLTIKSIPKQTPDQVLAVSVDLIRPPQFSTTNYAAVFILRLPRLEGYGWYGTILLRNLPKVLEDYFF